MSGPLSQSSEDADHGRVGYGRYGRYTPLALAALLVFGLLAIGLANHRQDEAPVKTPRLAGRPAPDLALTFLGGQTRRLADFRGSVVVVNFWASWCDPCRREAPAFQAVHEDAARSGAKTVIIGIDLKTDTETPMRDFVRDLGLTYPIVRDSGGTDQVRGSVERAFGIAPYYPTTIFIRPDGIIDQVHVGELNAGDIGAAVAKASQ